MTNPTLSYILTVLQGMAPPPDLKVSQYADASLIVASGRMAGTQWRTDAIPYQRGMLDVFHEPGIEHAVFMLSSQVGKTSVALVHVANHIENDPCPILVVQPNADPMGKDFVKNRLDPMIKASPGLRDAVSKKRIKDSSNTTTHKEFVGGSLDVAGAQSASSLAARSVRLLVLDEIDRYPAELPGEGSTIEVAMARTVTYGSMRQIIMLSSPTIEDAPIHHWFKRGDQRYQFIPCPKCACEFRYTWKQVKWKDNNPLTARIHCPHCDHGLSESERVGQLQHGRWISRYDWLVEHPEDAPLFPPQPDDTRPDPGVASFHIWAGYSPLIRLSLVVSDFIGARNAQKAGDNGPMHAWMNTKLGEPVPQARGEGVEPHDVLKHREHYPEGCDVPGGACILTMGVDVQDDRLEALIVAWGPGEECWLLDHRQIWGNTDKLPGDASAFDTSPWAEIDRLLDETFRHESGARMPVHTTCIDSGGHRTSTVYDYVYRKPGRRVLAIKGMDGERPIVSHPSMRRWGKHEREVPLYTLGVDGLKSLNVPRLMIDEPGPGYVHLPHATWANEEFAAQLTSERLVTKFEKGRPYQYWRPFRERNEALDMFNYALAALRHAVPDTRKLPAMLDMVRQSAGQAKPTAPVAAQPVRRATRSSYIRR